MLTVRDPERARRLARVLASDIAFYCREQVRIGLEKDDLFERIDREVERARVFFRAHVHASVADRDRIFDWAIVDVVVTRNPDARGLIS